ncbi:hypothetical protein PMAYCL1PPCAC_08658, partial [Pristionchus mayeri]
SQSVTFAPLDNEPRRGSTPRPFQNQTLPDTIELSRPMIIIIVCVIVLVIIAIIITVIAIQFHDRQGPHYEFERPRDRSQATHQRTHEHQRIDRQQQQKPYQSSGGGYGPHQPGGVHDTYANNQPCSQNGSQHQQRFGNGYSRDEAPITWQNG